MYNHFLFLDNSNPFITTTNKGFSDMLFKYYLDFVGIHSFVTCGKIEYNGKRSRAARKEILRSFAISYQAFICDSALSYDDIVSWQGFFTEYGRKYGLIREFQENGIL